jgi:peptidylprolyl isomerase
MTSMRTPLSIGLVLVVLLAGCRLREEGVPAPPDVAAPPADALRTESGLASRVLQVGMSNVRPGLRSTVRVHYTGWTTDGEMFDSSVVRGQPVEFAVTQVIPGWTEALQLMVVGEKRRFWIPGALAYDNIPDTPGAPPAPKGMLVFDIELIAVK